MLRTVSWLSLALSVVACAIALYAVIRQEHGINRQLRQREAQLVQRYSALFNDVLRESDPAIVVIEKARSLGDIIEAVHAMISRDRRRIVELENRLAKIEHDFIEPGSVAIADFGPARDSILGGDSPADEHDLPAVDVDSDQPIFLSSPSPTDELPTFVVYSALTVDGECHLYLGESDGGRPTRLSFEGTRNVSPAASPADGRVAYVSNRDGQPDIYILDVLNGDISRLTETPEIESDIAWSPDGAELAYRTSGTTRIVDLATGATAELPGTELTYARHASLLAYAAENRAVVIARSDGSETEVLTGGFLSGDFRLFMHPLLSPDGRFIAVSGPISDSLHELSAQSGPSLNFDVGLLRIADRTLSALTATDAMDIALDWSPDGQFLLVSSDQTGTTQLHALATDGSRMIQLTHDKASKQGGACWWIPLDR